MTTFNKIFEKNRVELSQLQKKSQNWFMQQAASMKSQGRVSPYYVMRGSPEQNKSKIIPGEMYMFSYDAKHKDTLPYWDMFPLVFPFRQLEDGFLGLNLHYLPYGLRARLLDRLMEFKSSSKIDERTRLKFSWATIEGTSRLKIAEPCVHRYLLSHVKSPFKKVDAQDWATAMLLPVERFVGASKQKVWTESMR